MRTTLLFLHIVGAGTWLGANATQAVVGRAMGGSTGQAAASWWRSTVTMGRFLYMPAGLLVLVTGILLVTTQAAWGFDDVFVNIGLAMVAVGIVLGIAVFGREGERAAEAAEAGDRPRLARVSAKLMGFGVLDTVLLVFTIWAMVARLGA